MNTKFIALISAIGIASICVVQAQSPTPSESPAAEAASPSAAESPSASPKAKRAGKEKPAAAETSPSAAATAEEAASPSGTESPSASPKAKRGRKEKPAAASPAVTPSPSPAKKILGDVFKPSRPVRASSSAPPGTAATGFSATPAPHGGKGLVWVNTETHVYHKQGSRFYGNTKYGKYVSEADAIKEGDKPSNGQ